MKVILISGRQGSGKSTLAKAIAKRHHLTGVHKFAAPLYEMHDEIHRIAGQPITVIDGTLLQYLGTEWGRKRFGVDVWVKSLAVRLKSDWSPVCVVDDLRFRSEAEHLKLYLPSGASVYKIRLNADEGIRRLRAQKWRTDTTHQSEVDLDDYKDWDLVIDTNSMCLDEYVDQVLKVCGL